MDDKLKKIIYIVLGAFAALFLFLGLISSCSNSKTYTPEQIETMMVDKTKYYYENHIDELPEINTDITLSLGDLTAKGIMGNITGLVDSNTNCSGYVTIENNNNYYMYSPKLTCTVGNGLYETNNLKEILLDNVVTSGNGLYNINNEYYFRGDNVDNYIMFDGLLWRIIKINADGTIKLFEAGMRTSVPWDDRYNSETSSTTGINNYIHNNINSRIKEHLDDIYNNNDDNYILSKDAKGYIRKTSLCVGKRSLEDNINDGSIECSEKIDNQYIGLLQLNEYMIASLDENCTNAESISCSNYNYLADFDISYWTITANNENNSQVYKIYYTVTSSIASSSSMAKMVINISDNTNVTGSGTESDPYIVTGMSKEIRKMK